MGMRLALHSVSDNNIKSFINNCAKHNIGMVLNLS